MSLPRETGLPPKKNDHGLNSQRESLMLEGEKAHFFLNRKERSERPRLFRKGELHQMEGKRDGLIFRRGSYTTFISSRGKEETNSMKGRC